MNQANPVVTPEKVLADVEGIEKRGVLVAVIRKDGNIGLSWSTMSLQEISWIKENLQSLISDFMARAHMEPAKEAS